MKHLEEKAENCLGFYIQNLEIMEENPIGESIKMQQFHQNSREIKQYFIKYQSTQVLKIMTLKPNEKRNANF